MLSHPRGGAWARGDLRLCREASSQLRGNRPPTCPPTPPRWGQSLPVRLPDPDDTDQTAGSAVRAHVCTPAARLQQAARGSTKQRKANTEEAVRLGALSTQRRCQDASRLFLAGSRACALIMKEATVNGGDGIPDAAQRAFTSLPSTRILYEAR